LRNFSALLLNFFLWLVVFGFVQKPVHQLFCALVTQKSATEHQQGGYQPRRKKAEATAAGTSRIAFVQAATPWQLPTPPAAPAKAFTR